MLKVNAKNNRYFDDGCGKPVYMVGSHTWLITFQKTGWPDNGWDILKWRKYLDFLDYWHHNSIRLWMWEHDTARECIWAKTSSGKFDLGRLNQAYFDRYSAFVREAHARNFYIGIMLFESFSGSLWYHPDILKVNWKLHPMHKDNNINGIDGDPQNKGYGSELRNVSNSGIIRFWDAYVLKMIDTFNGFDNIMWEIGNEDPYPPFSNYYIDFIHRYEKTKPKQHLVWYSAGSGSGNSNLYASNADIVGPEDEDWGNKTAVYFTRPPVVSHNKPEILDNDHIGNHLHPDTFTPLDQRNWTWKSFCRGYHPWHMDSYDEPQWPASNGLKPVENHPIPGVSTIPQWDPQRKSLGDTLRFAEKMKYLIDCVPTENTNSCSTGFCLCSEGKEYLAYQPAITGSLTLNIEKGTYTIETFDTLDSSSQISKLENWPGGKKTFEKPAHVSEDWVVYLCAI